MFIANAKFTCILYYNIHCVSKRIADINDRNMKKDYQILIILVRIFPTQLATKQLFKFLHHPASVRAGIFVPKIIKICLSCFAL